MFLWTFYSLQPTGLKEHDYVEKKTTGQLKD